VEDLQNFYAVREPFIDNSEFTFNKFPDEGVSSSGTARPESGNCRICRPRARIRISTALELE
jgi:hypothetical protein